MEPKSVCSRLKWNTARRVAEAVRPTRRQPGNQTASQPANQSKQSIRSWQMSERRKTRDCRVQTSRGRALAQTLCARSGPVPELFSQPESVNMILLLSRAETLMTLGRESLVRPGHWPTLATRVTRPRRQARRAQTAASRQHRGEKRAGMLEMSRRVGGAESRCQAQ